MKKSFVTAPVVVLMAVGAMWGGDPPAQAPNTLTKEEIAAGWKLLFDGKTLKGWEEHMASATEPAATWSAGDGVIYCEGPKRGWLGTDELFTDFDLKIEFRVGAATNSGVFLRSQKTGGIPAETGYELQIWDFRPTFKTGALVNAIEAEPNPIVADQWNSYDVSADGSHFVVVHNGKKVLDGRDSKHSQGVIGLQYNVGAKVEFRNIKIRPIRH